MLVFGDEKIGVLGTSTSTSREPANSAHIWRLVEGQCSQHCTNTAPKHVKKNIYWDRYGSLVEIREPNQQVQCCW